MPFFFERKTVENDMVISALYSCIKKIVNVIKRKTIKK